VTRTKQGSGRLRRFAAARCARIVTVVSCVAGLMVGGAAVDVALPAALACTPNGDCSPSPPPALSGTHKVGYAVFWYSIDYAAIHHNACTSKLAQKQLDAMMLAVTWREPQTAISPAASPMTLSRGDVSSYFWRAGQTGPDHRAYWHPGIGIYQYDDAGRGSRMSYEKFETFDPSDDMAYVLSTRWCARPGDWAYMYSDWRACDGGACKTLYDQIYSSSQGLHDVGTDSTVNEHGGVRVHTCRFTTSTATFTCHYVNPAYAQGNKWWTGNVDSSKYPLALPFYVFTQTISSVPYEVRVWLKADTGYANNITVRRPFAKNSRTSGVLKWYTTSALCDQSWSGRNC
jgi:hypothetical protein